MQIQITDAQDRIWTFHREYCHTLKSAGYEYTPTKPHIAIQHIIQRLKPYSLKFRTMDITQRR